ncbi:MAG: winged helix-turn-helix domain-containing protein [Chloroflexota bacterium]|nr:winged helix-turn-helix domain-containing protein [Chloroflexota bacterium]MDE2959391.1 winged helix-turn-helix domain-containing protein [Chloroflexota bacterium]
MARVVSALRRGIEFDETRLTGQYEIGALAIDYDLREARLSGRLVELTTMEFDLLRELSVNAGRAVTYDQIMRRVWRRANPERRSLVRSMVKNIRRKLGDDVASPSFIVTVPRVGYRMGEASAANGGG